MAQVTDLSEAAGRAGLPAAPGCSPT